MRLYEDIKSVNKFAERTINGIIKDTSSILVAPINITIGNNNMGMILANTIIIAKGNYGWNKLLSYAERSIAKNWKYLSKGILAPDFYDLESKRTHKGISTITAFCDCAKYRVDIIPNADPDVMERKNEYYQLCVSMTSLNNSTEFVDEDESNYLSAIALTLEIGRL